MSMTDDERQKALRLAREAREQRWAGEQAMYAGSTIDALADAVEALAAELAAVEAVLDGTSYDEGSPTERVDDLLGSHHAALEGWERDEERLATEVGRLRSARSEVLAFVDAGDDVELLNKIGALMADRIELREEVDRLRGELKRQSNMAELAEDALQGCSRMCSSPQHYREALEIALDKEEATDGE